jgi:hypothetical protein
MTTCSVSGIFKGADGVPLVGAIVQFKRVPLQLVGIAGDVVSGGTITAVTAAAGAISLELEPGNYIVSYSFFGEMNVSQALVPALPTADFADLFENPDAPMLPSYVQLAIEAKNEAFAAVDAAVAAADRAEAADLSQPLFRQDFGALMTLTPADVAVGGFVETPHGRYQRVADAHHLITDGGVKLYVVVGEDGRANIQQFGCVMDGTDDTAAFQAAINSGLPLLVPFKNMLITDTLLLDQIKGCDILGLARTVANAAVYPTITFNPTTKRDMFAWVTDPVTYCFGGVTIKGLRVTGAGPGIDAVFNLVGLYRGRLEAFVWTNTDHYARVHGWLDCKCAGNINGVRVSAFEIVNPALSGSRITTRVDFDVYISGGGSGTCYSYDVEPWSIVGAKIGGISESTDCFARVARGNTIDFTTYIENTPRTNTGALFEIGKTGVEAPDGTTVITYSGVNLHGRNSVEAGYSATVLADIDWCTGFFISGCDIRRFGALFKTTADSRRIGLSNVYSIGVNNYLTPDAVYDPTQHSFVGFRPSSMFLLQGDAFFSDRAVGGSDLELLPRSRVSITRRKIFNQFGKLHYRDDFGNFTSAMGSLTSDADSGWTFNAGRLANGEIVNRLTSDTGEISEWRSMRHSVDTPVSVGSCTTSTGLPTIIGVFTNLRVGDWVTVSAGMPSATVQYQIIAKSADNTVITLDTNATSSVVGTVTVATLAHSLEVVGQQGMRSIPVLSPLGVSLPRWTREQLYCSQSGTYWMAFGTTVNDWRLMGEQVSLGSLSVSPGLIAAGKSWQGAITVTGAAVGDFADVSYFATSTGLAVSGRITAADTCTVTITNVTEAGITPSAAMVRVKAKKAVV